MIRNTIFLLIFTLTIVGCNRQPAATSSSLNRAQSERVASAASILVPGTVYRIAPTGSMEPVLNGNSYVVAEKCSIRDISVGDIVAYTRPDGKHIVHRVIYVGTELRTRGDANKADDPDAVTNSNLLGRVVVIVYGKKI